MNFGFLLAANCNPTGVTLKKYEIPHPGLESALYGAQSIGKGSLVEYYYMSLIHGASNCSNNTYGKNHMAPTEKSFLKGVSPLSESATDQKVVQHPVWIVQGPLCVMMYINDT